MAKTKRDLKRIKQQLQKSGSSQSEKTPYKVPETTARGSIHEFNDADIRPQQLVPKRINIWVAIAVFAVTLIVYMLTQAAPCLSGIPASMPPAPASWACPTLRETPSI